MNRPELRQQLLIDEGIRLFPYKDTTGHLTIGVGRNLTDKGISDDEMQLMLDNDLKNTEWELTTHLEFFAHIDPVRQDVLINMAFNLGVSGLLEFHNTLAAIRREDWEAAADGMLRSIWAGQVGYRAIRLAEQMKTGMR